MANKSLQGGVAFLLLITLSGCSTPAIEQQGWRQPLLTPQEFFDGTLCADGVVNGFSGEQLRQFNAVIEASWSATGTGTLDEVFYFYDEPGKAPVRETRVWTLNPADDGYLASATDVPEPTLMRYAGNTISMGYTLRYGEPGDTIDLSMDDRMYMVAEDLVVNETTMTKFGIEVGQVLLVMRKVPDASYCELPAAE